MSVPKSMLFRIMVTSKYILISQPSLHILISLPSLQLLYIKIITSCTNFTFLEFLKSKTLLLKFLKIMLFHLKHK